ncbi:MAG: sulfotransferase domain-containing protein, partial [Oricola sp.]
YTIVSYPKSGRSWLRFMLCHAQSAMSGLPVERYIHSIPDQRRKEPRFYFVHGLSAHEDLESYHYTRLYYNPPAGIVLLVRDPVKVAASFYAHLKYKQFFGIRLDEKNSLKKFIENPEVGVRRYQGYLTFYLHALQASGVPFMIVRYEDLLADTVGVLGRILEFSQCPQDGAFLKRIAEAAGFGKMREAEESGRYAVSWLTAGKKGDVASMKTRGAFRKSRYADYSDEEQALMKSILQESPVFNAFGYFPDEVRDFDASDVAAVVASGAAAGRKAPAQGPSGE